MSAPTWMRSESELSTGFSSARDGSVSSEASMTSVSVTSTASRTRGVSATIAKVTSSTKLTIDELRPLVATSDDLNRNMATLQRIEGLDLSNGGIAGDQITELLAYIPLSTAPVALRSVDLGHNRLGDAGATALARLIQANASKLPYLVAVDLFENGIRDEGARAFIDLVKTQACTGNLLLLTSIALHDNDISETVLRAMDAAWRDLPRTCALGMVPVPSESESFSFTELVKRALTTDLRVSHMELLVKKLTPLGLFLKRVIWRLVAHERKSSGRVKLRVFSSNADPGSRVHIAASKEKMRELVLAYCFPGDLLPPHGSETSILDALLAQLEELHVCVRDAEHCMDGFVAGEKEPDVYKTYMETALSKVVGLPINVVPKTRYWYKFGSAQDPFAQDTRIDDYTPAVSDISIMPGYEITCELAD